MLEIDGNIIKHSNGSIKALYPIIEAKENNNKILVIYDYMAFPKNQPARNFFAYDQSGKEIWRAEDIGMNATDAYTNIISTSPLSVGNFSGFTVVINENTGKVINKVFTK